MSPFRLIQCVLGKTYSFVNRSGFLETKLGRKLFRSSYFFYKEVFEDPFSNLLKKHPEFFRDGDVLDIGANIGYTATLFSRGLDKDFFVHAFEPEPKNFTQLSEIVKNAVGGSQIRPVQTAVGDSFGTIEFWRNTNLHADHRTVTDDFKTLLKAQDKASEIISVPVTSVDSYLDARDKKTPISFIKIDVQGYEEAVCRGMTETLKSNPRAVVALEYCPSEMNELGFSKSGVFSFFEKLNYNMWLIEKNGDLSKITMEEVDELVRERRYVDFLFKKEVFENG